MVENEPNPATAEHGLGSGNDLGLHCTDVRKSVWNVREYGVGYGGFLGVLCGVSM